MSYYLNTSEVTIREYREEPTTYVNHVRAVYFQSPLQNFDNLPGLLYLDQRYIHGGLTDIL